MSGAGARHDQSLALVKERPPQTVSLEAIRMAHYAVRARAIVYVNHALDQIEASDDAVARMHLEVLALRDAAEALERRLKSARKREGHA